MNRFICWISLALTAVVLLGLAVPAGAQQAPLDLVPFKATLVAPLAQHQLVVIPLSPEIHSVTVTGKGQADLLGEFAYVDHHFGHPGVDGQPLAITDGIGVLSAASGDALFVTYSMVARPSATQGVRPFEGAFTVAGGKGKFLGATGSGVSTIVLDTVKMEYTQTWAGMISRPK
jgi:hypothetical protein